MPTPNPGLITQVNAIVKYVQNPCNAPWAIYFETAVPAFGTAIMSLLEFGFDDVVRGALRPGGLRSHKHTKRGRKGRGGFRGIPELGELLGSQLPGAKEAKGRKVTQGVKNLWLLDGVIQRLLWYWLVVDITVEFFYAWTSAIQKTEFCEAQGVGSALSLSDPSAFWFSPFNAWTTPPIGFIQYANGFASARFGSHTNNGKPFQAVTSASVARDPILPGGALEFRLMPSPDNAEEIIPATVDAMDISTVIGSGSSAGLPRIYQYRTNGGAFRGQGEDFTMGL